jgi:hypothetical protein
MTVNIELECLVQHMGKGRAQALAEISREPSLTGVSQRAFDLLAKYRVGLPTMYGAPSEARRALEALQRRYPASDGHTGRRSGSTGRHRQLAPPRQKMPSYDFH